MDRGTLRAVVTPATTQFVSAVERVDWERALGILDQHWVEIWFAIDPTDLRGLVSTSPPQVLGSLRSASYIARAAGNGSVEDLLEPETMPGRGATTSEIARYISDVRLRGRPAAALAQVRKHSESVRAQRGQLLDGSGGTTAMWLVQAAITALLAGEAVTARGFLLEAVDSHRPDRFPFIVREAAAKLALTHAITGDVTEASRVNERARAIHRTESWVESMVDDTIWLTDYVCAVDALDPRAEQLRQEQPSPMAHGELWPFALHAQVRHLVLTGRPAQAAELCDTVAAVGLPPAGADGLLATALPDARASISLRGVHPSQVAEDAGPAAARVLARALHLFTAGQYAAVARLAGPPTADDRVRRALALLQAQAKIAKGSRAAEGRSLLQRTLREIVDRGTYGTLSYLTRETLESIADTDDGARAIALVERSALPTVEVRAVLTAPLSEAEIDALRLLRAGLTREQIAERLFLSVNTVKTQLSAAYRKLGVTRRPQALEKLALLGL